MLVRNSSAVFLLLMLTVAGKLYGQSLPPEFDTFRLHPEGKAIFSGEPGQWDSLIRERGWVMREQGRYRMWYTGYNPDTQPVTMKLGYAESPDGIHWKRHPQNPVYDEAWVEDMMVVRHGDAYFMFAEGAQDQAQLLASPDGIQWKRLRTLDIRLTSGRRIPPGPFGTPTAWFEDGTWYLFYERRDQGVWLATSTDMRVWTNVSDNPVLRPGPDDYDRLMIAMNQVFRHDGRYYAVMHGTGTPQKPRNWCTWFAVSDDLVSWQKCRQGPVLPVADNKSSGVMVRHDGQFRLYTMHARVDLYIAE